MQGYERGLFKILLLSNLLFIELIYKFICRYNEFRIVSSIIWINDLKILVIICRLSQ
jgi:hypothetical protein